jgi:hypothetical protein
MSEFLLSCCRLIQNVRCLDTFSERIRRIIEFLPAVTHIPPNENILTIRLVFPVIPWLTSSLMRRTVFSLIWQIIEPKVDDFSGPKFSYNVKDLFYFPSISFQRSELDFLIRLEELLLLSPS